VPPNHLQRSRDGSGERIATRLGAEAPQAEGRDAAMEVARPAVDSGDMGNAVVELTAK